MQTNQTEAQQMAAALLAYLNQLEILPVNIALERAEERPAAVMTLREEPAYRRYDLAGGYKAQFPFAVSFEWESFPAQTQAQEPEERYQTKFTLIYTQEEQ